MKVKYKTVPMIEISLDELRDLTNSGNDALPFEYQLGAYSEMDTDTLGEMANIQRLLAIGSLPPSEEKAIYKTLKDLKLNPAERKAKERAIQKLRNTLLRKQIAKLGIY